MTTLKDEIAAIETLVNRFQDKTDDWFFIRDLIDAVKNENEFEKFDNYARLRITLQATELLAGKEAMRATGEITHFIEPYKENDMNLLHNRIIQAASELPENTEQEKEVKSKLYNLAEDVREQVYKFETLNTDYQRLKQKKG